MSDWWDTALTWGLLAICVVGLLWVGWRWLAHTPSHCPTCGAVKGKIHKPKCDYLVQQSGG